jgi:hypothetical protein
MKRKIMDLPCTTNAGIQTAEMLSIPGVGVVTIAGFLAEIGDINSYDHGQQIIRFSWTQSRREQFR